MNIQKRYIKLEDTTEISINDITEKERTHNTDSSAT